VTSVVNSFLLWLVFFGTAAPSFFTRWTLW
jgi:hypothetical protein